MPTETPPSAAALRLVFKGECLPGHEREAVHRAVAQALKLDTQRAAQLFSGRRVVLRRQVDTASALRYVARFAKMGAVVHAEPVPPRPVRPRLQSSAQPSTQPLSWQPSRPVLMGTAGLAVVLLLAWLLGPGLAAWWARGAPAWRAAEAPAAVVPAVPAAPVTQAASTAPVTAPAPVAGTAFDDELPTDMGPQALRDYREQYLPAAGHKAFAIGGPSHAWQVGAASENDAREAALMRCMRVLPAGASACRVVDANGELTE